MGIPRVMLKGNVTARAMGMYNPGLAFGTANRMAAGTAIYEALAAKMANRKRFPVSIVTTFDTMATKLPLKSGTKMANKNVNHPCLKNDPNFLPLVMPISSRKMAKKPLKISVVKGLIPSA